MRVFRSNDKVLIKVFLINLLSLLLAPPLPPSPGRRQAEVDYYLVLSIFHAKQAGGWTADARTCRDKSHDCSCTNVQVGGIGSCGNESFIIIIIFIFISTENGTQP